MYFSALPITLNHTLPACLTIASQLCLQDTFNHTPEHALKYTPNCSRWRTARLLDCMPPTTLPGILSRTLPIALDGTLPATLTVSSQVISQNTLKHIHKHAPNSQLHSMAHSQRASLYTPKEAVKTLPTTLQVHSQVPL
jgi:hypothetical protein